MSSSFGGADRSVASARNLGSLFGGSATKDDRSTRSLAYTAPKEPAKSTPAPAVDKAAENTLKSTSKKKKNAIQYAYVGRTRLYKLEKSAYIPASPELLGCVVLGSGAAYQLLVYDNQKRHVLAAPIAEVAPITPQANGYVTFTCQGATWSAHFDNEETGSRGFCRAVALSHALLQAPNSVYELAPGEGRCAETGDPVVVLRQTWPLDRSGVPTAPAKDPPSSTETRRIVAGSEDDAIARAVVGVKSGAVIGLASDDDRWVEVEILEVVERPTEVVVGESAEGDPHTPPRSSIAERMAGLAAAGGVVGVFPPPATTNARHSVLEASRSPEKTESSPLPAVASDTRRASSDDGSQAPSAATKNEDREQNVAMAAMQSSIQTQSTLLALQSSLSQVHEKLDRALTGNGSLQSSFVDEDGLEALANRVSSVLRDHASLRSKAADRDSKRSELEEKLESLREKNSQLVGEKLAIMEKHAELLSKGNDETTRARDAEEAGRDAIVERDRLLERISKIESERLALTEKLEEEERRSAELSRRLADGEKSSARVEEEESEKERELAREIERLKATTAFLEGRCEEAERSAQNLARELEAAAHRREDSAIATAASPVDEGGDVSETAPAAAPEAANASTDGSIRDDLVKTIMSDAYRQLCAYISQATGNRPDVSLSASDVAKAIKVTLKKVTAKYLLPPASSSS